MSNAANLSSLASTLNSNGQIGTSSIANGAIGQATLDYSTANGTGAMIIPGGSYAQRPNGSAGMIRICQSNNYPIWYNVAANAWSTFGSAITSYSVNYLIVGGGGGSGNQYSAGGSGTINTGGGGAGGSSWSFNSGSNGGSGGSGIVILSIPTSNYSSNTTGSPTVTTSNSNTIISFTSSGTYTA